MVCFTAHSFQFDNTTSKNWFKVLCKYYENIAITLTVDGEKHSGKITKEFFEKFENGKSFTLETEQFWSEYAVIKTIPKFIKPNPKENTFDNVLLEKVADQIDDMLQSRLAHDGQEMFMTMNLASSDFDLIKESLSHIKTTEITRMFQSKKQNIIAFVLKDRHTMVIINNTMCDGHFPIFDVDDGFLKGLCSEELNDYFKYWRSRFDETKGDSWDEPIIY